MRRGEPVVLDKVDDVFSPVLSGHHSYIFIHLAPLNGPDGTSDPAIVRVHRGTAGLPEYCRLEGTRMNNPATAAANQDGG